MNGTIESPNVVIVGRPNVGKSALFNRLAGRKIAIVHDQPGITRDRISAASKRGTRPFTIWDTGGVLGAGETELTSQVRRGVDTAISESDLVLFVVDAKHGLSPIDREFARLLRKSGRPVVLVVNKIDNDKHEMLADEFEALGFPITVAVSAEHNRGLLELYEAIDGLLPADSEIENRMERPGSGDMAGEAARAAVEPSGSERDTKSEIENPIALAIIGRPNVGKSSLINSIIKSERTIVSQLPGTTRDAVDISYARDGERYVLIDTAGIRRRGRQSSSVEVFSVMRSDRSVRRADLCILIADLPNGVTAHDKKIAGLIQKERKAAIIVVNKFDLLKRHGAAKKLIEEVVMITRERLFFLDYAPVLVTSALTGEHVQKLFRQIDKVRRAANARIGTGVLNRLLRAAFAANPPPMRKGKRLKLFYAAQAQGPEQPKLAPPEFVLFVNDPSLLTQSYERYLQAQIREAQPYPGLPVLLTLRPRSEG